MGATVSLTELLQPYWEQMTLDRLNPISVGRRALRTLRGWERLLAAAPANLQPILRQLKDGTIGVEFRIRDADSATDRLVDGILAAASILASAELIGRRTSPRIRDVSIQSDRAQRWCGHLATPAGQSRRPPQQPKPHPPTRRPRPKGMRLTETRRLNRSTLIIPRIDSRCHLDDGRPPDDATRVSDPDPRHTV